MSASEAQSEAHKFPADFKKTPGTLSVTATHIAWVPTEQGAMDRQSQALNRVVNMLASKAGSAKVSLKLLFKDEIPAGGLHFTFTNPNAAMREEDRKIVQDILIPFVAANRAGGAPSAATTPAPATNGADAAASGPSTPNVTGTPTSLIGKRKLREEENNAPSPAGSTGSGGPKRAREPENKRLKIRVLKKNPHLGELFRALVSNPPEGGPRITEAEFWQGREALLRAEEIAEAQRPGRQPRLIDDRFGMSDAKRGAAGAGGTGVGIKAKADTGPEVLSIGREDIAQIFEEFPVVQHAYAQHVPGQMSETEFWSRYFQSQLWERHRASERKTVNDEAVRRKDDIFDLYLEDPDWNVQPKEKQPDHVERFLDLSATEEDHGETATQRDHTMQAGRERGALPLIRRFNANAARLSKGVTAGESAGYLNTALPSDTNIYDEIDLEDLRGPAEPETISIQVQDSDEKEGEAAIRRGIMPGKSNDDLASYADAYTNALLDYAPNLASVSLLPPPGGWEKNRIESGGSAEQARSYERYQAQKLAAEAAGYVVRDLHIAANAETTALTPLPHAILEAMRSCHNAATEFLRQYWSALLPLPAGALGGGPTAIPKNKEARDPAKAAKMANYLRSTEKKIEAVVHTATIEGINPERIRTALAPTLCAVNTALRRETTRLTGAAS